MAEIENQPTPPRRKRLAVLGEILSLLSGTSGLVGRVATIVAFILRLASSLVPSKKKVGS